MGPKKVGRMVCAASSKPARRRMLRRPGERRRPVVRFTTRIGLALVNKDLPAQRQVGPELCKPKRPRGLQCVCGRRLSGSVVAAGKRNDRPIRSDDKFSHHFFVLQINLDATSVVKWRRRRRIAVSVAVERLTRALAWLRLITTRVGGGGTSGHVGVAIARPSRGGGCWLFI